MKYKALINIMPHKELLDPQGKTVKKNMSHIDIDGVDDIRIGKRVEMILDAKDTKDAASKVETACKKLLANVIMESYEYSISEL